ncbi:MAG: type I restriction-modification system subunit M [Paludibacteraceae bacterium]|nr:type I restriction-modification system subunit M [Paludibacteraceae bacterium]
MAKKVNTKAKAEKSIEAQLWDAANKLRGNIEAPEYKHVVLSLIFLKYAGVRFEKQHEKLVEQYGDNQFLCEVPMAYGKDNVFYLPEECRWSYIMANAKSSDIAQKIDKALAGIEANNKSLQGALPSNYYSSIGIDSAKLGSLIDIVNNMEQHMTDDDDFFGRVYEYCLSNFALQEGKGKGEYYTPKSIVNLITEMIEPYKGKVYDPACGSGGMFVQSSKFIEAHGGNKRDISVYGQEYTLTTYKLAKMNLAIRGISANFGEMAASTFQNDQHKAEKFDYIMANPPFNQKDWRSENELTSDPRWNGFKVPPVSNANYAWILNIYSKLANDGIAGFLLANGALSGDGDEKEIRKELLSSNHDAVEAIVILPRNMFYTTDISVTLWILNRNKHERSVTINGEQRNYRERAGEILFMDLRTWGEPFEKKYTTFSQDDIDKAAAKFHQWQRSDMGEYKDEPEFCKSVKTTDLKDYSLVPSKYIEFVNRDNYAGYEETMSRLQTELRELFAQGEESKKAVEKVFEELGYKL